MNFQNAIRLMASKIIYVSDSFNRSNSSTLGTSDNGKTWSTIAGNCTISSNTASLTGSTNNVALLNVGVASYEISCDIVSNSLPSCHIVFRSDSGWSQKMYLRLTATALQLVKENTVLDSYSTTRTNGQTYNLKLICNGSNLSCYLDETLRISFTDSSYSSNTYAGLYSYNSGCTFDNFKISSL